VTSTEEQFPALSDLLIDGRNYYNACKSHSPPPIKCMEDTPANGSFLAISHYKPLLGESFLASDFLRPITMIDSEYLEYLVLTDLILDPSPLPLPTLTVRPEVMQLRVEDFHNSQSLTTSSDTAPY
jgi:hypothetical protein